MVTAALDDAITGRGIFNQSEISFHNKLANQKLRAPFSLYLYAHSLHTLVFVIRNNDSDLEVIRVHTKRFAAKMS